jgi:hypothetical protein
LFLGVFALFIFVSSAFVGERQSVVCRQAHKP